MHLSPSIGHDLVTGTRFMGAFTIFALSILLAFVNRGKTQLKVYNQARWLIFTGCLLLCIFNLVQFLGNFREQSITLSWAITTMFLVAIIPPYLLGQPVSASRRPRYEATHLAVGDIRGVLLWVVFLWIDQRFAHRRCGTTHHRHVLYSPYPVC